MLQKKLSVYLFSGVSMSTNVTETPYLSTNSSVANLQYGHPRLRRKERTEIFIRMLILFLFGMQCWVRIELGLRFVGLRGSS